MPAREPGRRGFGYIRKLPSGRYQCSYVGPDLQRHTGPVTFTTKDAAVVWLAGKQLLIEDDAHGVRRWSSPASREQARTQEPERETLATYAARWLDERRSSRGEPLRALTRKDYEQILRDYILPTLGSKRVADITRADVRAWHRRLDAEKPRTKTKAYGLLRALMNSAVDEELITASPVHIRGGGAVARRRDVEPATVEEITAIAANMPDRLAAAVHIAAWCALRFGELAELRRSDIDTRRKVIKVRRAVVFLSGGAKVGPTKSDAGRRDVAVPPHVWPIIQQHLREHVRPEPNALLFPSEVGRQISHSSMNGTFSKARAAAGRDDLRWHDLRHTGATLAAQAGATMAELQARLGHSTVAAAQLYQHAAKNRDREIADRLSQMVASEE